MRNAILKSISQLEFQKKDIFLQLGSNTLITVANT